MSLVILGDCVEALKKMDNESIDLIITSPPYKSEDGFTYSWMRTVLQELYRVQKSNSLFFLNFGHLAEDKFRPFAACQLALECGFGLNETITWVKNHYKPIQGKRRVNNLTEFIFVLVKGKMPVLNRMAVGIPYVDKSNATRFNKGLNLHCAGNVWYINYPTITKSEQKPHNDRFPLELPERCIKLCGYNVRTVLDPYCGSGTTCLAAKNLGKEYIGIDCNPLHVLTAKKLLGL
jgi:site-specific DNA-methyltransferase (adenine-specific)